MTRLKRNLMSLMRRSKFFGYFYLNFFKISWVFWTLFFCFFVFIVGVVTKLTNSTKNQETSIYMETPLVQKVMAFTIVKAHVK